MSHDTPIYMALDADASKKETKIINLLLKYGIELYKIDTIGYEDVAAMPKDIFERRKEKAGEAYWICCHLLSLRVCY